MANYKRFLSDLCVLLPKAWTLFSKKGAALMAVRVHLADDHTMFREGLEAILASRGTGIEVVGRSSTGEEAVALVESTKPDVVITEVDMQLKEAEEILCGIRSASPDSRTIVLTMHENFHYLKALSKLGVDAYLLKTSSSEELIATIDAVSRDPGGGHVMISMPRALLERLGEEPVGALSERETEILVLAARGLSNYQIATELRIAEPTVKRHLANVYAKIGVRSRSEAVRTALAKHWIGLHEITANGSSGG